MNSKPIKKILAIGFNVLILIAVATTAHTEFALGQSTSIARIEGESDKSVSLVTIGLSNRPTWGESKSLAIEDHGTFVQVMLPETVVPSPGTFLDANSPVITKIAAFQVTDETTGQAINAAIRLFVNQDASQVRQALVAELLADRVVITLDHKRLQTITEVAKKTVLKPTEKISSDMPATKVLPSELVPEKSALQSSESPRSNWSSVGAKVPNLAGKLAIVSGFSLFMLILLGITHKWRKIRRSPIMETLDRATKQLKHRVPSSENGDDYVKDNAPMGLKTLTTMTVAPRQKLALMQAGSETILLSITPNGIQFLTKIGDQAPMESMMASMMAGLHTAQAHANPMQQISNAEAKSEAKNFADRLELASTDGSDDEVDQSASSQTSKSKVRVAVTDDGITNIEEPTTKVQKASKNSKSNIRNQASDRSKPSDDITRMIREKLRNLPVI